MVFVSAKTAFFSFRPRVFHYWWIPASDEDCGFVSSKQVQKIYRWLSPGSCSVKTSRVNSWLWLFLTLCHFKKLDSAQRLSMSACWDSNDQPQSFFSDVVPVCVACVRHLWLQSVAFGCKMFLHILKVKTAFGLFFSKHPDWTKY